MYGGSGASPAGSPSSWRSQRPSRQRLDEPHGPQLFALSEGGGLGRTRPSQAPFSPNRSTSRTSTAPPVARRSRSRAGTTRESFTTASSPARTSGRSRKVRCSIAPALAAVHEEPGRVARLDRTLRDELLRKLVVEERSVHPTVRVASPPMDDAALRRVQQRLSNTADRRRIGPGRSARAFAGAARGAGRVHGASSRQRSRPRSAKRFATACAPRCFPSRATSQSSEASSTRRTVASSASSRPLLAERQARIDDLALLVELVSSGWRGIDTRLARLEAATPKRRHERPRREAADREAGPSAHAEQHDAGRTRRRGLAARADSSCTGRPGAASGGGVHRDRQHEPEPAPASGLETRARSAPRARMRARARWEARDRFRPRRAR